MDTSKALSIREQYGVIDPQQVAQVVAANLGTGTISLFDLDIVHVPNSGAAFEFPALGGMDSIKSFAGIIVTWREMRRYYAEAYKPGVKTPPTCSSEDMINGTGTPGGRCDMCPFNEWGTATAPGGGPGRGKACSQYRYLFVTCPGRILPIVLAVPPSSLGAVRKYFMQLTSYNRPFYSVVTEFGLERGDPVPIITFKAAQQISPEELGQMAGYLGEMKRTFAGVDLTKAEQAE